MDANIIVAICTVIATLTGVMVIFWRFSDKIDNRFSKTEEEFWKISNKMEEKFEKLDKRLDKIEDKISDLDTRLTVIETVLQMMGYPVKNGSEGK